MISNSAIIIANNDDLLTEIFLRLPIKSLLRFKSVSKHWLSVITHPYFHRRRKTPISGIIFNKSNSILTVPEFDFISFNGCDSPFTTLEFSDDNKDGMTILSSCNGLLCCTNSEVKNGKRKYYVYNPSTRNFTGLPDSPYNSFVVKQRMGRVNAVTLAFDPAKSPHYNVVLVVLSDNATAPFQLEVYSSETGKWKRLQRPLFRDLNYKLGVYWNGAVNWFGNNNVENGLYFHVAKERFVTMAMPPRPDKKRVRYMQESYGHLHLIDIHGPNTAKFKVYEMRGDYSGWFVKYEVDIERVMNAFPESVSRNLEASDKYYYKFLTASVVRGEKDGDSFLVFSVPGKVVRYNFADGSFMVLRDFGSETSFGNSMMLGWFDCFQYIESFSCV